MQFSMGKLNYIYSTIERCKSRFIKKNSSNTSNLRVLSSNKVDGLENYTSVGIPPQNVTFVKEDIESYIMKTKDKFDIMSLYFDGQRNNKLTLSMIGYRHILNKEGILMVDYPKDKYNSREPGLKGTFSTILEKDLANCMIDETLLSILYLINERFYNELATIKGKKKNPYYRLLGLAKLNLGCFTPIRIDLYTYDKDNESLNCNLFKLVDKMMPYADLREDIRYNRSSKIIQHLKTGLIDAQPRWCRKELKSAISSCLNQMNINIDFEEQPIKDPLNDFVSHELLRLVDNRIRRIQLIPPLPEQEEKKVEKREIEEKPKKPDLDGIVNSLLKQKYLSRISQNTFLRMKYFVEDTLSLVGEEKTKQIANEVNHSKWYKRFGRNPRDTDIYSFFDDITIAVRKGNLPTSKDVDYMASNIIRSDKDTF